MDRTLSQCLHKFASSNCKVCGIYNHSKDPAIKTALYDSYLNCSAQKYLKHMRRRQCQPVQSKEIHEETYCLLLAICDKFEYQMETLALGVYIYAKTYGREEKQVNYQRFWASASLMVASKAIELDRKVPYMNRYQRYAQKSYVQSQYEIAERKIFELLNYDIQRTTFVSYLNFYLTNGMVFKSDGLFLGSLKYFEDDVMVRASDYIKNGEFLKYEPEKLALRIIKEVRGKYHLSQWTIGIGKVSGFKQEEIENGNKEREKIEILKPINNISLKKLDKLSTCLSMNLQCLSSTNLMQQKLKSFKKRNEFFGLNSSNIGLNKIQSMKQNTRKDEDKLYSISNLVQNGPTSAPLSVLRNQLINSSVMNVNANLSLNSSFNRINGNNLGNNFDGVVGLGTYSKRA